MWRKENEKYIKYDIFFSSNAEDFVVMRRRILDAAARSEGRSLAVEGNGDVQ